jgi:hypothetical protein
VSEAFAAERIDALTAAIDDRLSEAIAALEKNAAEAHAADQLSELAAVSERLTVVAAAAVVNPVQAVKADWVVPSSSCTRNS